MAGQPRERGSRASRKGRPVRAGPAAVASDPDPASGGDSAPRSCDEAHELEDRLLKRLDEAYKAALSRLADLGYDQEIALEAVLHSGHCYGNHEDPVANIVGNARAYLSDPDQSGGNGGFADLRRLEDYSLAGLVCLLQSNRPTLTRPEAMWCLLSSDLRLKEAIAIGASLHKTAPAGAPRVNDDRPPAADTAQRGCSSNHSTAAAADPALFDPETFMRLTIRQGPANAPGVISCIKTSGWSRSSGAAPEGNSKESFANKLATEELIESVVSELEVLDIDKKDPPASPDPKNQMVHDLIKQTREMEMQLKERKEWAQGKAIQAARKLGADLTELRILRMEHDENQRRKNEKQVMEDDTLKRLAQLETELKKKSGQLDRSNAAVQRLEMENAEIRAEMEAAKLSASETEKQCQILARKEKKDNKKLEAWERQKAKLKEEIADCQIKITQAERELAEINKEIKNMEIKIQQDTKIKEDNIALLEEERRKREAAKVNADRRLEELRQKKQIESQCYRDDLHRLQDELNRLQKSTGTNQPAFPSVNSAGTTNRSTTRAAKQTIQRPTPASNRPPQPIHKPSHRRECVVCKDEACVILLPCVHQVLCVGCNKLQQDKGVARCPCCSAKVEERIRVFGASSN